MLVGLFNGLVPRLSTIPNGLFVSGYGIIHGQRDVFDTVAVGGHFLSRLVLGRQTRLQNQSDVALTKQVGSRVPATGGQISVLLDLEPKVPGVEIRGLLGVAAIKANVVHIVQTQRIAGIDFNRIRAGTCLTHNGALHEAILIVRQGRILAIRPRIMPWLKDQRHPSWKPSNPSVHGC